VYIFVVMHVASRRIVLINATTSPGLAWVKQQIRQATEWARCPRFLLHDNDGVYGQYHQRRVLGEQGRRYRCHLDQWLAEVMGIEGIPIPYGAPNSSPHVERFNRTLREEALNHFIFLDGKHVLRVCRGRVGGWRGPGFDDADVSILPPEIPYGGFSPVRLQGWPFPRCLPLTFAG
jgi:hypothetical protein